MIEELKGYIKELERRAVIRSAEVIDRINEIIQKWSDQENKQNTLLEDVQNLYIQKYWSLPMRYKNDINRLSSKL